MQINPLEVIKRGIVSNIQNEEEQVQQVGIDLTIKENIIIKPKEFINIVVNESFNMQNTFGIINVRSSLSRKGIFTTSGIYDPGFVGIGGVSIYNMSNEEIKLEKGFRIGQIVVFEANAAKKYEGFYNTNKTEVSKYENKI